MAETELVNEAGVSVFRGTQRPPGGGSRPGQAIYGDGSDGDIVVASNLFDWPDPSGVPDRQDNTAYAVGDQVKTVVASSVTQVRIYECIAAGTSGSDPDSVFAGAPDGPGAHRRGDRGVVVDGGTNGTDPAGVIWEQVTMICQGYVEGPIFAHDFTVAAATTLNGHGWPIYATGTLTIEATAELSGRGFDAIADQPAGGFDPALVPLVLASATHLLGVGIAGQESGFDGNLGDIWGGGAGGAGGAGADSPGGLRPVAISGADNVGWTLGRRSLATLFLAMYLNKITIGASGSGGSNDGANLGGGSGSAGSALALLAHGLVLAGDVSCRGGAGGDGGSGGDTGGGGGGGGGCCVLVYDTKTGAGNVDVTGGTGGAGHGTGTDGGDGSPGDFVEFVNAA